MSRTYRIVVLPGDGVGPEVTTQALNVLHEVARLLGIELEVEEIPCGGHYYLEHGEEWPPGSFEKCKAADAIFLGAVGHEVNGKPVMTEPGKPYPEPQLAGYGPVIGNRKRLDLYANVRPIKLYPGVRTRISGSFKEIWKPEDVDYVIVRENTEDAYTGETHKIEGGLMTPIRITREATEKVVRFAFRLAQRRRGRVTCVDKSNIVGAHRLFRDIFTKIGREEFPEIELDYAYFDAFCQWQMRNPEWYDVVVAPNLVGDVISDNGATQQGGLGLAAGANIGDEHAMFEPIHGSAPRHAGKGKVNPMAAILAMKMMLEWLGERFSDERLLKGAQLVEEAVASVLKDGKPLTYDLVGEEEAARTSEVGAVICAKLADLAG
jgi:3-isopropylmalate dehydrogenase